MKHLSPRNSLGFRILYCLVISLVITTFSLGFTLITSLNLQDAANKRFEEELFLQELQSYLDNIETFLESYLSTLSSSSLTRLLYFAETLNKALPQERLITTNKTELMQREVFFLFDSFLDQVNQIIEEKRGRKVRGYTENFERISRLYAYISQRIDATNLNGFRNQMEEYRNFLALFRKVQMYSLLLILLAVALSFSFLMHAVSSLSRPMKKLSSMAEKISLGNFDIPEVSVDSVNEVNRVAQAFNNMKNSIHHYIGELQKQKEMEQQIMNQKVRNLKMEQLLKRMELYTMQAQMNPHFLFNTINTGVQLAIVEEAEKTADFMENLAALFRYNIREEKFFVSLRHEYDGLKSYFAILKIRFPKILNLELEVEEDILNKYTCPAMILQPLVENSVIHAFKNREGIGTVSVSITFEDPVLILAVRDDGVGIPEKTVKALLTPQPHDYQLNPKVMGLENVIQRLYFFYPNQEDVIDIKGLPGEGTEILIRIHTEVQPCIGL